MDGTWVATRLAGLAIVLSTFVACGGGGSGGGGGGQGAGEPQGGGGDATLATLVVTPARASNHPLFQTTSTTATFGIPIPQDWGVGEVGGRPALGIVGSSRWQFRTLDQWPDGSVRWALVDIATTVGTGQPAPLYDLVPGDGVATTPDIGRVTAPGCASTPDRCRWPWTASPSTCSRRSWPTACAWWRPGR